MKKQKEIQKEKQKEKQRGGSGKRVAVNALCGLLTVALAALTIFLFVGRSENRVLFISGRAMVWILSPSMEDTIPARSYVLIRHADAAEVTEGDIIVFYSDDPSLAGALNTHRVVEVVGEHTEFVTRGDNNLVNDQYGVRAENVVGIYEKNLTALTSLMRFFMTRTGIISLTAAFLGLIAAMYIPDMVGKGKRRQQETQRLVEAEVEKLKLQDRQNHKSDKDTNNV